MVEPNGIEPSTSAVRLR